MYAFLFIIPNCVMEFNVMQREKKTEEKKTQTLEFDSTPPILFQGKTKRMNTCSFRQHFSIPNSTQTELS